MSVPNIEIRRSGKAKRMRLAVKVRSIELVVPLKASEAQAMAFLNQHRHWAEQKWLELNSGLAVGLLAHQTMPWRGKEIPLIVREAPQKRVKISIDEVILIVLPEGLGALREKKAQDALYAWVVGWLKEQIILQMEKHIQHLDLAPRHIRVKQMKTRWGSCGPLNDININWLLAFAPDSVLEYVIVHELCHIRERNHSKAFWLLVEKQLPDFSKERA